MLTWVSATILHGSGSDNRTAAASPPAVRTLAGVADRRDGIDASELADWLQRAVVEEAAAGRRREHWHRVRAEETATMTAVLLDAAERRLAVRLRVSGRGWEPCRVTAVAAGFCVVDGPAGPGLVATGAVEAVDLGGRPPPADDRPPTMDIDLAEALALMLEDRPELAVWPAAGGEPLRGELRSVGTDVVTLRDAGRTVVVPVAAIARVAILG